MKQNKAFTLIELLVVIAIIAMLLAIVTPSLRLAREKMRRLSCLSNQRSIVMGLMAYSQSNSGRVSRCSTLHPGMPYAWENETLVEPLLPYIGGSMDIAVCPSRKEDAAFSYNDSSVAGSVEAHYGEWTGSLLWLPGLNEIDEMSGSYAYRWNEDPPSAVSAKRFGTSRGTKIVLVDKNIVWMPLNDNWGIESNHSWGGRLTFVGLSEAKEVINGSNRIYADGHGEWVRPKNMGHNNTPITDQLDDCRYSHDVDNLRPYYW